MSKKDILRVIAYFGLDIVIVIYHDIITAPRVRVKSQCH